jgi:CheY-like chemotaxis protein
MRPKDPYDQPLRVIAIEGEIVFLGEGPVHFSMTREAATQTLGNLAGALEHPQIEPPEDPDEAAPRPCLVLVVEDEPLVRKLAAAMLEDAGYAVIQADGSRQALLALEARGEIHLLFTDVEMPGDLDGIALAGLVRRRWPRVRLLVTSGALPIEDVALPAGGRFLPKPYLPSDVLRHVGELIGA